jgi:hypothetical protein
MRTLFLIGILAILVLIATKKPNQTAWEAADGFAENVKVAISNTRNESSDADKTSVVKQVEDALSEIKLNKPIIPQKLESPSKKETDEGARKVQSEVPIPKMDSRKEKIANTGNSNLRPSMPYAPEAPKPPAIPRTPVQVSEIGEDVPPPEQVASSIKDYEEVRSFYENASRLLRDIK